MAIPKFVMCTEDFTGSVVYEHIPEDMYRRDLEEDMHNGIREDRFNYNFRKGQCFYCLCTSGEAYVLSPIKGYSGHLILEDENWKDFCDNEHWSQGLEEDLPVYGLAIPDEHTRVNFEENISKFVVLSYWDL